MEKRRRKKEIKIVIEDLMMEKKVVIKMEIRKKIMIEIIKEVVEIKFMRRNGNERIKIVMEMMGEKIMRMGKRREEE